MKNNYLNNITGIEQKVFTFSIILFSLLSLIPNKVKGLPVMILILVATLFFFRKIKNKKYLRYGLIFSFLPVIYLISMAYTSNFSYGLKKLETTASLFLIPIALALIYERLKSSTNFKLMFIHVYIWSATVYALSILWYFNYLGLTYCLSNLSHCLSYVDGMFILSDHPIYVSMFLAIGLIFITNSIFKQSTYIKLLYFIFLIILAFVVFLLMRKGIIIALVVSFIGFFILNRKYKKANYVVLAVSFCVILILCFNFRGAIKKRFSELVKQDTYELLNENNSTSIRYSIYSCSTALIRQSPIFGYGIGDVTDQLVNCYKSKSEFLVEKRYNSHNQFIAVLLYVGFIGFILFIWQLYSYFKNAFLNRDTLYFQVLLFFVFVFLTENILDRQSGVIIFSFIVNFLFFNNLSSNNSKVFNS